MQDHSVGQLDENIANRSFHKQTNISYATIVKEATNQIAQLRQQWKNHLPSLKNESEYRTIIKSVGNSFLNRTFITNCFYDIDFKMEEEGYPHLEKRLADIFAGDSEEYPKNICKDVQLHKSQPFMKYKRTVQGQDDVTIFLDDVLKKYPCTNCRLEGACKNKNCENSCALYKLYKFLCKTKTTKIKNTLQTLMVSFFIFTQTNSSIAGCVCLRIPLVDDRTRGGNYCQC